VMYSYNESQRDALFLKFILIKYPTCFRQDHCHEEYLNTVYMQQVFILLVLLASQIPTELA
jgi:hypothetical protein